MQTTSSSCWEQQADEPAYVYEVARVYFEDGPRRSLKAAASACNRHPSTVARWSARYDWQTRARAYDAYRLKQEDEQRRLVLEEASRTEAQKWKERLKWEREEEWQTAQALIARAREMLACPLEDTRWNWRDAAALITQAAKLVRLAAGEQIEQDETDERGLTVRVEYVDDDQEGAGA
jgi:hypothetical protein